MTNCCNDYGQCTQGHDCPARMSHVNRECHETEDDDTGYIPTLFGAIAMAAVSAICGLALAVLAGLV